ncbi:hypothetical protein KY330_01470 [Candidatus Woesearchaeota archaeon]|nr:hypothetical protein [Candidatus Woesearchaeota archaeon]
MEDIWAKLVPRKQEGWEYVKQYSSKQKNILIIYHEGKFAGQYHKLKINGGFCRYDKSESGDRVVNVACEHVLFESEQLIEPDLEALIKEYTNSHENNIINSYCDHSPETFAKYWITHRGVHNSVFTSWALQAEPRYVSKDDPRIKKYVIKM